MKSFLNALWISGLCVTLFSCDNEVILSAEYEDTTVIYGLINANADTQFIKVNRAFLDGNTNALSLARNPDRLYYDSLTVQLRDLATNGIIPLDTIVLPKEDGIFTNERNILYFTDSALLANRNYRLEVIQADGKLTYADAVTLDTMQVSRPQIDNLRVRPLPLTSNNGSILDYNFQFSHSARVAEFEATLYLNYQEQLPNGSRVPKSIAIPIGKVVNDDLVARTDAEIEFPGRRFYETIANAIDPSNQNPKILDPQNNITIEIYAADEEFAFYADIYGPIDGLAQVRPEYTNIENGIGLFASRSRTIAKTRLSDPSRQQLRTGGITGNLNFVDQ